MNGVGVESFMADMLFGMGQKAEFHIAGKKYWGGFNVQKACRPIKFSALNTVPGLTSLAETNATWGRFN